MPTRKEYAYYVKGGKLAIVQKDWTSSGGQTLSQPALNDIGLVGALLWKSPIATVADGLEIQYVHSPNYFINETDDTNTTLDTYKSTGGFLILEDTGSDNFSASPESLADGSFIVLRNAGKWNGLHKVSAAGAGYINTYTKYSGSGAAIGFEETVTLYYNVSALDSETDALDIPRYLANGLVYYVKAKYAEDAGNIEMKEYFMKEFRRITEKHQSAKKMGTYRAQGVSLLRS